MNPLITEHNEKVDQLHNLAEWFIEKYKGHDELSEIAHVLKDTSLRIAKLIDEN